MSHDELSALLVRIMWGTNYGAEMNVFTCKLAKQRGRRGEGEIQKRPNCKSKEIESQAVLNRKVSNIKTFLPRGDGGG